MIGDNEEAFVKRLFGNLVLAAVVVAVFAFFAAPAVAFFAIRSAAEAGDVAGLSRLIDFGAVRQSLRPQLAGRPEALAPAPSFLEDPIGAFRRQWDQQNPLQRQPDVNAYLTPAALSGLLRGEGRYASQRTLAGAPPGTEVRKPWPRPAYWSVKPRADGGRRPGRFAHPVHLRATRPVRVEAGPYRSARGRRAAGRAGPNRDQAMSRRSIRFPKEGS